MCARWRRLCGEVRGVWFDLGFASDNSRAWNGHGMDVLRMLSVRWRWVDALIVDGWNLGENAAVSLLANTHLCQFEGEQTRP